MFACLQCYACVASQVMAFPRLYHKCLRSSLFVSWILKGIRNFLFRPDTGSLVCVINGCDIFHKTVFVSIWLFYLALALFADFFKAVSFCLVIDLASKQKWDNECA